MREPGECVTDDETKRKIKPIPAPNEPDEQNNSERRADEMKKARHRLIVFSDVKIPKFRVSFDFFIIFRHNFYLNASVTKRLANQPTTLITAPRMTKTRTEISEETQKLIDC